MDNVIIMLYWGGNMCIGQDGLYYDTNSRSFVRLRIDATYDDLVTKVVQKMGVDRTRVRLKFTCRFSSVIGFQVSKFMPFEVNDDESLQVILEMASKNTAINSLDIYVDIENIPDTHQTLDAWIGPYTSLLTQEVESSNPSL